MSLTPSRHEILRCLFPESLLVLLVGHSVTHGSVSKALQNNNNNNNNNNNGESKHSVSRRDDGRHNQGGGIDNSKLNNFLPHR
jgi:hypothetical protein